MKEKEPNPNKLRGKFITFEGIDGSGKTTQMRLLASDLRAGGADVLATCEPGGTPLGKRLRAAFLETEERVDPLAELLLFAADRAQHVEFLVKPALAAGKIVLSDRYADATAAYQGGGRGFSAELIARVIELATGGLKPDLTLFFDLSIETALERTNKRGADGDEKNRMDKESFDFYQRVRDSYLKIAETEPERFIVIDAADSVEAVRARVSQTMKDFFEKGLRKEG